MKKVAIDLTWLRHEIVGGAEPYINNLLDGFVSVADSEIEYYLLISRNNYPLYKKYSDLTNFNLIICNKDSNKRILRVLWQNFRMCSMLKKQGIDICIEPVYLKPFTSNKGIRFITTVHDLQAAHYPEYFSKFRVAWMWRGWINSVKTSDYIIVTSEDAKRDIESLLNADPRKLVINYDPVTIDVNNYASPDELVQFGIKKYKYYYMVTSLLPHKNIETIIKALGRLKRMNSVNYYPLVISGVGGKSKEAILKLAADNRVEDNVIITPFIDDYHRNMLYKFCKTYLAPSLFEGFGLPPIEAMIMGAPLLSTYETCSYEISNGLAEYVDDARDPEEWASRLNVGVNCPDYNKVLELKDKYSKENVASIFNKLIKNIII